MYITKVLKRKDAASLIVAIWIATATIQALYLPIYQLSDKLSRIGDHSNNNNYGPALGWRSTYLSPVIVMVLNLVVIEVLLRLIIWVRPLFVRKRK